MNQNAFFLRLLRFALCDFLFSLSSSWRNYCTDNPDNQAFCKEEFPILNSILFNKIKRKQKSEGNPTLQLGNMLPNACNLLVLAQCPPLQLVMVQC